MFQTEHFIFVHMPKTGGQFVRSLFREGRVWNGPAHERVPPPNGYGDLPIVGFVRNPWDWYVSLYYFLRRAANPHGAWPFSQFKANPMGTFDEFATAMLDNAHADRRTGEHGFMSWHYLDLFEPKGQPPVNCVGRQERLHSDVISIMEWVGYPDIDGLKRRLSEAEPVNVSENRRRDYRDYFTPILRDRVAAKERLIIETFGYTF